MEDLLWRSLLVYRGRINMDHCVVHHVPDGRGRLNQLLTTDYQSFSTVASQPTRGRGQLLPPNFSLSEHFLPQIGLPNLGWKSPFKEIQGQHRNCEQAQSFLLEFCSRLSDNCNFQPPSFPKLFKPTVPLLQCAASQGPLRHNINIETNALS